MKRLALALAATALLAVGVVPAEAASYAGAGVVTGAIEYARPLTGTLGACHARLPVGIRLSSPAFTLKTPTGAHVVPLTVTASGVAHCESEDLGSGRLDVVVIEAGGMRCEITGAYTRPSAWMTLIAAGPRYCSIDEDGDGVAEAMAPGWSWIFNLAYATGGTLAGTVVYEPY